MQLCKQTLNEGYCICSISRPENAMQTANWLHLYANCIPTCICKQLLQKSCGLNLSPLQNTEMSLPINADKEQSMSPFSLSEWLPCLLIIFSCLFVSVSGLIMVPSTQSTFVVVSLCSCASLQVSTRSTDDKKNLLKSISVNATKGSYLLHNNSCVHESWLFTGAVILDCCRCSDTALICGIPCSPVQNHFDTLTF